VKIEEEVRKAVKDKAVPLDIGKYVKTDSILNTLVKEHRLVARFTDYAPDPDHEAKFIAFWEYNDFIYWKLADLEDSVSIIGIVWDTNMKSRMFYALILPPD